MAYAAYRDHEVLEPPRHPPLDAGPFQVLHVTVRCADAWRVRRAIAACADAGVLRSQLLLHEGASTTECMAPRARLMIRLASSSYLAVLQALMHAVPSGELGQLVSWREHLRRCGLEACSPGASTGRARL
ncbi:hypothetical protein [Variovorax sp. OV329]|uniref:hypothetical protein n=1 Tax=Variovorax sp. OV329 TaxID=1882825 RepID=UPI0008EB5DEE|nr:hypothetical protein [Variovorax sp. OV329]SFM08108.1 hypothetical protein SAMN05444747_102339 [Variovorax sp. OV329]